VDEPEVELLTFADAEDDAEVDGLCEPVRDTVGDLLRLGETVVEELLLPCCEAVALKHAAIDALSVTEEDADAHPELLLLDGGVPLAITVGEGLPDWIGLRVPEADVDPDAEGHCELDRETDGERVRLREWVGELLRDRVGLPLALGHGETVLVMDGEGDADMQTEPVSLVERLEVALDVVDIEMDGLRVKEGVAQELLL
jgi:hypothetical protein